MTKKKAETDAERRDALREKIAAGNSRNSARSFQQQARDAAEDALDYVKAHPLKTVTAVAVGALLIGALTRPGRRAGRKAGAFAGTAADAALTYGLSLLQSAADAASKGQAELAEMGRAAEVRTRGWRSAVLKEGGELSEYLQTAARRGGKRASKTIDDLRSRISH